jgi:uncharacterized protein
MIKKIFLLLIHIVTCYVSSQPIPEHQGEWVIDKVGLLSIESKEKISNLLKEHQDSTSNQIVVLIIPSLDGHDAAEYANKVFNAWKIGQKQKNNGVLLLISKKERIIRIEVGYGLEGALTDLEAYKIIHSTIIPYFKKGNFDEGVLYGVKAIFASIKGEYDASHVSKESSKKNNVAERLFIYFIMFLLAYGSFFYSTIRGVGGLFYCLLFLILLFFFFNGLLPKPFNLISYAFFSLIILYRRIFSKKTQIRKFTWHEYSGSHSIWGGGGWVSNSGNSWSNNNNSGSFLGGGGLSGGGGAMGKW